MTLDAQVLLTSFPQPLPDPELPQLLGQQELLLKLATLAYLCHDMIASYA